MSLLSYLCVVSTEALPVAQCDRVCPIWLALGCLVKEAGLVVPALPHVLEAAAAHATQPINANECCQ